MNLPSRSLYIRTPPENEQVHVKKLTGRARFGILPNDVMGSMKLTAIAKVALSAMGMEAYGSGEIAISHQALAILCGSTRQTISDSLKQLCEQKVIEESGRQAGQVQPYRFLHPKFQKKPGAPLAKGAITAIGAPPPVACVKCRRICARLPEHRTCRSCASVERTERIAERISRKVTREELAKKATA